AVGRPDLGRLHEERVVGLLRDVRLLERPREAGPPGAGVKLVERAEQRLPGPHVHVDAGPMVVPVLVVERWLRRLALGHLVLSLSRRQPERAVARVAVVDAGPYGRRRGR